MKKNIGYLTVLLAATAGYCDTVTFVAADNIFSAHVTGNFIVFAYQIINGNDPNAMFRLLTFPVFIISILIAGWIVKKSNSSKYELLYWEGVVLTMTGIVSYILKLGGIISEQTTFILVMFFVVAMGFQNAFGKIYSSETLGPTTMMTGNVTQLSLELGHILKCIFKNRMLSTKFLEQLITVMGFLTGCLMGAIAGKYLSLGAAILPGLVLTLYYFDRLEKRRIKKVISDDNHEIG
ncbi:YoaK family protein [Flavobacterium sp. 3-210]